MTPMAAEKVWPAYTPVDDELEDQLDQDAVAYWCGVAEKVLSVHWGTPDIFHAEGAIDADLGFLLLSDIWPWEDDPKFFEYHFLLWGLERHIQEPEDALNITRFPRRYFTEILSYLRKNNKLPPGAYVSEKDLTFTDYLCLLYTSPSPRDQRGSRMPSSA